VSKQRETVLPKEKKKITHLFLYPFIWQILSQANSAACIVKNAGNMIANR
jgi:hypothetical protein